MTLRGDAAIPETFLLRLRIICDLLPDSENLFCLNAGIADAYILRMFSEPLLRSYICSTGFIMRHHLVFGDQLMVRYGKNSFRSSQIFIIDSLKNCEEYRRHIISFVIRNKDLVRLLHKVQDTFADHIINVSHHFPIIIFIGNLCGIDFQPYRKNFSAICKNDQIRKTHTISKIDNAG